VNRSPTGSTRSAALVNSCAAAALLFAGCGPGKESYSGPRGPEHFNACALFPASDAKAELRGLEIGQVSGPLDATSGKKFARCAYGYGPEATVVVALEVRRHEGPETLRRKMEASLPLLRRLTEEDVAEVNGLGDVAWWAGAELRLLKVGWRDLELLVTVHPGDEPGFQRAVAERIARRALHRLAEEPIPEELELSPRTVTLGEPAAEAPASEAGETPLQP
jgi:hypothetical protein